MLTKQLLSILQEQQFQQGYSLPGPYPPLQTVQYSAPHEEYYPPDIGYQPSCVPEYPQEYIIGEFIIRF